MMTHVVWAMVFVSNGGYSHWQNEIVNKKRRKKVRGNAVLSNICDKFALIF
jgi:hypothetical protein